MSFRKRKKTKATKISTERLIEQAKRSLPLEVELFRPYRYQVVLSKGVFDFLVLDLSVPPRKENALKAWRAGFQKKFKISVYIHRAATVANLRKEIEDLAQGVPLLTNKHVSSIRWKLKNFCGEAPRVNDLVRTLNPPSNLTDLTPKPFVAIDDEDTSDREDVLYARKLPNGSIRLYVGYIDVSWFVRPGSEVDDYAQRVGFTQYGSRRTIPTLGPDIATGPASFLLNQNRIAWVVELTVSPDGHIRNLSDPRVYRALVRAHQHLTPYEVNAIINGIGKRSAKLSALAEVASALRAYRARAKKVIEVSGEGASGVIISECMIAANYAIAKFFLTPRIKQLGINAIFKVHTPPTPEIRREFIKSLSELGVNARDSYFDDPVKLGSVLDHLENIATAPARALAAHILDIFLLRSSYDTVNSGHHGVGVDAYSKFKPRDATALANTYQLDAIDNLLNKTNPGVTRETLSLEELNKRAHSANRKLREYSNINRRLRFFENIEERLQWIGQSFYGKVADIREGEVIYVDLPEFTKWGVILFSDKNGNQVEIGDLLKVRLEGFSVERMRFQFELVSFQTADDVNSPIG